MSPLHIALGFSAIVFTFTLFEKKFTNAWAIFWHALSTSFSAFFLSLGAFSLLFGMHGEIPIKQVFENGFLALLIGISGIFLFYYAERIENRAKKGYNVNGDCMFFIIGLGTGAVINFIL